MTGDERRAAPAAFAAIGECMIELSGGRDDLWRMGFAGDTFNTAWYMRQLLGEEHRVAYVTALGEDPFSDRIAGFAAEHGIAADRIRRIADRRPGLYAITLDKGERRFTYWRDRSAARLLADDPEWLAAALAGCRILHVSGITLAILAPEARRTLLAALADARKSGGRVSFDTNFRPALWSDFGEARAAMTAAYAAADVVLPTFEDERALFGDASPDATVRRIGAGGATEIVVKNGAEPCLVATERGSEPVAPPAAVEPVDTTGAGDSFNAGYLAARFLGHAPDSAAAVGHKVAAQVIQVHGALTRIEPSSAL